MSDAADVPADAADPSTRPGAAPSSKPPSSTPPSYEAARAELAEVMRALESGGQSLEESLDLWKRGEELADICQRWLDQASARLDEAIAARADSTRSPDSAERADRAPER